MVTIVMLALVEEVVGSFFLEKRNDARSGAERCSLKGDIAPVSNVAEILKRFEISKFPK